MKWSLNILMFLMLASLLSCSKENAISNTNTQFEDLLKKAENGDAQAPYELVKRYVPSASGSKKDDEEIVKWYRMAAENGHAEAQLALGLALMYGKGVTLNPKEAVDWLQKAAEQGVSNAQMTLGFIYVNGYGCVREDYEKAYKWNLRAAKQGNSESQRWLSWMYTVGMYVNKDFVEAYKWGLLAGMQVENINTSEWLSLSKRMTTEQIIKAQELAKAFVASPEQ